MPAVLALARDEVPLVGHAAALTPK
jgi:hypothetical protein